MSQSFDVAGYLQGKGYHLKPAGGSEWHLACFFHGEDPGDRGRLYVNCDPGAEILGLFECKVCGERGALPTLMRWHGDEVPWKKDDPDDNSEVRLEILRVAAAFYHEALGDNEDVFTYLRGEERMLTAETIMERQLGYAADEIEQDLGNDTITKRPSRALYRHLRDLNYTTKDILDTGLVTKNREDKIIDSLSGMITIPYRVAGNVVQIRGRAWPYDKSDKKPKYRTCGGNSSRLFNTDAVWNNTELVVTEGEFDAMVVEQLGYPAVGVPGAKGWQDAWDGYVKDLRRIWLVFDRDPAGEQGAEKITARFPGKVRRIHLSPEGFKCDPTQWVANGNGPLEFAALIDEAKRAGLLISVDQAIAEHAEYQGVPGIKFGVELLDMAINPGMQAGQLAIVLAKTGCMAGDTLIPINRAGKGFKIPISKMYERWEGIKYAWDHAIPTDIQRAEGDVIRLGRVSEVWQSGVKPVWEVVTAAGRSVAATAEHPFLTPDGWKKLGELNVGNEVLVNGGKSRKGRAKKPHYYIRSGLRFHPHARRRNVKAGGWSVPLHRLVVEAARNGFDLDTFLAFCREGPVEHLVFLEPWEEVHHVDFDPHNNELANLKVVTTNEHRTIHAVAGADRHVLDQVEADTITTIRYRGEEMTYDISVADEPHNFIANGFVVHNTGKTIFLLNMMQRMLMVPGQEDLKFLFLSLEQTRGEWWERARRIHRFYNLDADDSDAAAFWRDQIMIVDKNRLTPDQIRQAIDDFDYQMGQLPDVLCLDYIGYFAQSFRGERYERTSDAVMGIKEILKDTRIRGVAPHQVSRMAKDGEEFGTDAARDSGAIEETSDFLFNIWSPDNTLARAEEEKQGIISQRIAKSRNGSRGLKIDYRWGPLSLVMVPTTDPLSRLAQDEMTYNSAGYRDDWATAVWRHKTGIKGAAARPGMTYDQIREDDF